MKASSLVHSFPRSSLRIPFLWRHYLYCYCVLCSSRFQNLSALAEPRTTQTTSARSSSVRTHMSKALGKQEDDPWRHVGGTAVNEKTRSNAPAASDTGGFDPIGVKAHLQHAIEGLERYPRYLSRWNSEQDIDRLEQALQDQLKIVRAQRAEIAAHKEATKSLLESFLQSSPRANEYWTLLLKQPSSWDEMVHQRQMWDKDFVRAVEQSWKRHGDRNMVIPLPWTSSSTDRTKELVLEAGQLEPIVRTSVAKSSISLY